MFAMVGDCLNHGQDPVQDFMDVSAKTKRTENVILSSRGALALNGCHYS